MSSSAIQVSDLGKTYKESLLFGRKVEALKGVSFNVEEGCIFGLLGPNGAGKTTLIKVLLGIVRKTKGEATMLGAPAGRLSGRKKVGYLPESHRIPRHLTANSALEYYGGLSGLSASEVRARRDELLKQVGLESWGNTSVKKYSKGMLQRLGLAQAMLHDPELLILDEPTDGVDPVGRSEMRSILRSLKNQGRTILMNSHLLQEIELVCDKVAILNHGRLLKYGAVDELTIKEQSAVELVIKGEPDRVSSSFGNFGELTQEGQDLFRIRMRVESQEQVDKLVQHVLTSQLSLCELIRPRDSLEDAFLAIVRDGKDENAIEATVIE